MKYLLIFLSIYTVYFLIKNRKDLSYWLNINGKKKQPLPEHLVYQIKKYSPFFRSLPEEEKIKFCHCVKIFIEGRKFIPRGRMKVTNEMKVLIASSAVQISFGFPRIDFLHFNKILIYETDYYSKITRKYHAGEVNPRFGIIVISWVSFKRGISDSTDGIHLGLHEMAHALKLENKINNGDYNFLDSQTLKRWYQLANEKIRANDSSFFRASALQNIHEFFAVCVESLFERTEEFKTKEPELFFVTKSLLNLDLYLN